MIILSSQRPSLTKYMLCKEKKGVYSSLSEVEYVHQQIQHLTIFVDFMNPSVAIQPHRGKLLTMQGLCSWKVERIIQQQPSILVSSKLGRLEMKPHELKKQK
jgi:hypothetical protein